MLEMLVNKNFLVDNQSKNSIERAFKLSKFNKNKKKNWYFGKCSSKLKIFVSFLSLEDFF